MNQKFTETDRKTENRLTNWKFITFFWKPEMNLKYAETDPKKKQNDQQTENL